MQKPPSGGFFIGVGMFSIISLNVQANVDNFEANLHRAGDIAESQMNRAAANADQFQTRFEQATSHAGDAADHMGQQFQAANDSIQSSADNAASAMDKVSEAADKVDVQSWQEKVSAAFGAGVGAGVVAAQTWFDKVEEFAKKKLEIIGIGLALVAAGAITYTAFKAFQIVSTSIGFLTGLVTGSSYKSENIDAVIALNDQVKTLQSGLHVSAIEASALNEALKAGGVDRDAYVSTMKSVESSVRTNTDELDRLGVKYKDTNGNLLPLNETLANAKRVLDEYTVGWDRNQAAAAIGMGSYEEVSRAVSITTEKVETAKQRLIDYGLIIGPATQAAVAQYEESMRAFQRETDLTGQGFKKAIADQVMPILTDLSDLFRDGFPFAVQSFRYSMATLTSLFYGLKEVVQAVLDFIVMGWHDAADVSVRSMDAIGKALHGDFKGAWAELKSIPGDFSKEWDTAWDKFQNQSKRNLDAMKLAWGADNFKAASSPTHEPAPKGKTWVPKPEEEDDTPPAETQAERFLRQLKENIEKVGQGEYAMLRYKAAELGVTAAAEPLISKLEAVTNAHNAQVQRQQENEAAVLRLSKAYDDQAIAVDDYRRTTAASNDDLAFQLDLIGKSDTEIKALTYSRQQYLQVQRTIRQFEDAGTPMQPGDIAKLWENAAKSSTDYARTLDLIDAKQRDWHTGMDAAFRDYQRTAGATADNVKGVFTTAFKGMEDAILKFVHTGKLSFSDLVNSVIDGLLRIQIQESITKPLAQSMSSFNFASLFAFADGGIMTSQGPVPLRTYSGGGIANSPQAAIFAEGGVPEAFVPVPSGRIPVELRGVGGGGGGSVTVNVIESPGGGGQVNQRSDGNGGRIIDVMVEQVKAAIAGDISRGTGPIPSALSSAYGMNRVAGAY